MALLEKILDTVTPKSALEDKLKELSTYKYESRPIKTGNHSVSRLIGSL